MAAVKRPWMAPCADACKSHGRRNARSLALTGVTRAPRPHSPSSNVKPAFTWT